MRSRRRHAAVTAWCLVLLLLLLCTACHNTCSASAAQQRSAVAAGDGTAAPHGQPLLLVTPPSGDGQLLRQPDGSFGALLPLSVRHGVPRGGPPGARRRLQKLGAMTPVLGAVTEGYFYAHLAIGTPPRTFSTIIDTGSTITYIPCSRCQHCGHHMDAAFDPNQSATARWLGCGEPECSCGNPPCGCKEATCYYTRHYAEDSSSEGWLVSDKLHLSAAAPADTSSNSSSSTSIAAIDFVFGCENAESGEIYKQAVDGVLGMGNSRNAFPRQLARSGLLADVFSLCYGFPAGGAMLLGSVATEPHVPLRFTPLVPTRNNYYMLKTHSLALGGKTLAVDPTDFARGYGTVLDSGTTFSYLPSAAYTAFLGLLRAALAGSSLKQVPGADATFQDVCWTNAPHDWAALDTIFPGGNITFAGGAFIELLPYRYLFAAGRGTYCLGLFDNGSAGTLLGGIITRNVLVQYDKEANRVGMGHADCTSIKAAGSQAGDAAHTADTGAASSSKQHPQLQPPPPPFPQQQQQHPEEEAAAADGLFSSNEVVSLPPGESSPPGTETQAAASRQTVFISSGLHAAASPKVMWLGVSVGVVLVLVILQLGYITFCQRQAGGKGSSSSSSGGADSSSGLGAAAPGVGSQGAAAGALLPLRLLGAARQQRSYQQVAEDEQELVDLSERAVLLRGASEGAVVREQQQQQQ